MNKKSKYKGVTWSLASGKYEIWTASKMYKGKKYQKTFKNEREAALAYDKFCISFGLEPVNILKRKK